MQSCLAEDDKRIISLEKEILASQSIFKGKIIKILNNPIKADYSIWILRSLGFIKGCGNKMINLHIHKDCYLEIPISEAEGKEVIFFGCQRDESGINWDTNNFLNSHQVIFLNKNSIIQYENTITSIVKKEYGCTDCCESATKKCLNSIEDIKNTVFKFKNNSINPNYQKNIDASQKLTKQVQDNKQQIIDNKLSNILKGFLLRSNQLGFRSK